MKLWVIRHAKSSWKTGKSDFDRPLNKRGERDGPRMAAWLATQDNLPVWIVSSNAARAHATADFVCAGANLTVDRLTLDPRLYLADADTILDVIRETPDDVETMAVVCHNPGITDFVNDMLGEFRLDNLPTFGIAKLDVNGPWVDLTFESARLDELCVPKQLG
jgi:phosphohistidine phosphatase